MKLFPKVTSPCPYKGALSDILDGDICRLCKKAVHDITDWSQDAKEALMADCSDEVCVTYRFDARPALAAAAAGAAVFAPSALAAQEAPQEAAQEAAQAETHETTEAHDEAHWEWIIVGGVRKDTGVVWQAEPKVREGRELPVEYETIEASKADHVKGERKG